MSLKNRVYSVLIVSSSDSFHAALTPLLPETTYYPVRIVASINSAKRLLAERSFDFLLINSPLTDDNGISLAMDTCTSRNTVVLLFIKNEILDGIYDKVAEYGVFTLPKPTSKTVIAQALNWMISARERLRLFEAKSLSLEEKMAEIRLVNRAKWFLISELNMSENDAHHYIEKQAMDQGSSKKIIAETIIKTYS